MARGLTLKKTTLKVLKAVAELEEISVGELLERIVRHSFEGKVTFSDKAMRSIQKLKAIYDLSPAEGGKEPTKVNGGRGRVRTNLAGQLPSRAQQKGSAH